MSDKRFTVVDLEWSPVRKVENFLVACVCGFSAGYYANHWGVGIAAALLGMGIYFAICRHPVLRRIWMFASILFWGAVGVGIANDISHDWISWSVGGVIAGGLAWLFHLKDFEVDDSVERIG